MSSKVTRDQLAQQIQDLVRQFSYEVSDAIKGKELEDEEGLEKLRKEIESRDVCILNLTRENKRLKAQLGMQQAAGGV